MSEFILGQAKGVLMTWDIVYERDGGGPREIVAEVYSEEWGEYIVKSLNDYAPEPDFEHGGQEVMWTGDPIRKKVESASVISCDDLQGWNFTSRDTPRPRDRPVWVITEYLRRCVVRGDVFVKWSLLDTRSLLWHPMDVGDIQEPPEFPVGLDVSRSEDFVSMGDKK